LSLDVLIGVVTGC